MFLSCLTGISIDDLYLAPEHSNNFASEKVWNVRTMKRQNYEKTRQLHGLLSLKRCFTQKPSRFLRKDQTHCSQYRDLFVFDRSTPQHLFWSFKTKLQIRQVFQEYRLRQIFIYGLGSQGLIVNIVFGERRQICLLTRQRANCSGGGHRVQRCFYSGNSKFLQTNLTVPSRQN